MSLRLWWLRRRHRQLRITRADRRAIAAMLAESVAPLTYRRNAEGRWERVTNPADTGNFPAGT